MNKFEQLIEYVINDEDAKARELFHDIVVEKSRQIYEEMMEEETTLEEESTQDEDEKAEKAGEKVTKDIEYDDKKDRKEKMHEAEEEMDESLDEMGGDQADDLIDDVEAEEEGISMEGEDDGEEAEDLEDRVVDLEDKLDELMAEFEELMGGNDDMGDEMGDEEMDMEVDMDAGDDDAGIDVDMDSEEVVDDEFETEGMMENVSLKAAPTPVKSEESGVNKKSTVAANSGAKGAVAKPVHASGDMGGHHDSAAYKNSTKEMIGKVGNTPGQSTQDPTPATKPQLGQAAGVNTKSVIQ